MAPKLELVLDCADPDKMAEFWVAALGYDLYGSSGNYRSLIDPEGVGPKLILQGVDEPKVGKNRIHFDLLSPDIETEASRLICLGAVRGRAEAFVEHGTSWVLLADPEGNEFCVCQA
jgi:predicted enzyme related to lactoylglutathione lyase